MIMLLGLSELFSCLSKWYIRRCGIEFRESGILIYILRSGEGPSSVFWILLSLVLTFC